VNNWIVQPVVGFFRRLVTMIGRGGKRALVVLAAMVRTQRPAAVESNIVADNFTPDCAVRDTNKLLFFAINDNLVQIEPTFTSVLHMFVSPDKRLLCIVHTDRTEILKRTESNQLIRVHTINESFDRGWWSPDNSRLGVRKGSGQFKIYNVKQGFEDPLLSWDDVDRVSWSPDSETIAIQSLNGGVTLIDINTRMPVISTEIKAVVQMAWSPRIRFFAAVTQTGGVQINWKQKNWQTVSSDLLNVQSITWSPQRDFLLVTTKSGKNELYKSPTLLDDPLNKIALTLNGNSFEIPDGAQVVFSPTAEYIAITDVSDNRRLSLFKLGDLSRSNTLTLFPRDIGPPQTLSGAATIQWIDKNQFAVSDASEQLSIYRMQDGVFELSHLFAERIQNISVNPDTGYMLVHQANGVYALFDVENTKYLLFPQSTSITDFYLM
jgi:WD40 repeat protein